VGHLIEVIEVEGGITRIRGKWCLLEQNVFNIVTLSFDDNKILKIQFDMLIVVQMYRTIG
jgi:hypothetical protein